MVRYLSVALWEIRTNDVDLKTAVRFLWKVSKNGENAILTAGQSKGGDVVYTKKHPGHCRPGGLPRPSRRTFNPTCKMICISRPDGCRLEGEDVLNAVKKILRMSSKRSGVTIAPDLQPELEGMLDRQGDLRQPSEMPVMSVADKAVAAGLESLDSVNTRIAYETQWRLFTLRCDELGLTPLPADPATVVDYLVYRGVAGVSSATLRQVASAITNAHGWAGYESPCGDRRVRECRKGLARRLAKPPREGGALTDDAIRDMEKHAGHRRARGRGSETKEEAAERAKVDVALVNVMSDAGLRRSEGEALTWGNVQHWKDGSGRITVACSQAAVESQAAVVAITVAAMRKLDAIRPPAVASDEKVFGLSGLEIARRVKASAKAAKLSNWESFNGSSGRVGMAQRMVAKKAPSHVIERHGRRSKGAGNVVCYTDGESAGEALQYL